PDLAISNSDDWCEVYENVSTGGRGLVVALRGSASNRFGVGAKVAVEAGGRKQAQELIGGGSYFSHNELALGFGLGEREAAERLDVVWPSGKRQRFARLPAGRRLLVSEGPRTAPPASP
ncbi:MAG: ASPIC/UnbV domain-containing protein, partial [Thermoanaerobaculia bacterium]